MEGSVMNAYANDVCEQGVHCERHGWQFFDTDSKYFAWARAGQVSFAHVQVMRVWSKQ